MTTHHDIIDEHDDHGEPDLHATHPVGGHGDYHDFYRQHHHEPEHIVHHDDHGVIHDTHFTVDHVSHEPIIDHTNWDHGHESIDYHEDHHGYTYPHDPKPEYHSGRDLLKDIEH